MSYHAIAVIAIVDLYLLFVIFYKCSITLELFVCIIFLASAFRGMQSSSLGSSYVNSTLPVPVPVYTVMKGVSVCVSVCAIVYSFNICYHLACLWCFKVCLC